MSILDQLLGGREDENPAEAGDPADPFLDGNDDPFGGSPADDFGGDFEDDFGAIGDMEDSADTAELGNRLDELENEIGSLSSTVTTIRSENEEISGSLHDVEENIRQLLEIYEMVTRGVNPFVDDSEVSATSGSMELFNTEPEEDTQGEVDETVANADAEDFFNDDFMEDDATESLSLEDEPNDPIEPDDEFDTKPEETIMDDGGESTDGKSFEELKAEYESGDADWIEEEGESEEVSENTDPSSDAENTIPDVEPAEESTIHSSEIMDSTDDVVNPTEDLFDEDNEFENNNVDAESGQQSTVESHTHTNPPSGLDQEKPYIDTVPPGYLSDLLVIEWLEYLVEISDVETAAQCVAYYESIEWIGECAADSLFRYLAGFEGSTGNDLPTAPNPGIPMDHHTKSLQYIARLDSAARNAFPLTDIRFDDQSILTSRHIDSPVSKTNMSGNSVGEPDKTPTDPEETNENELSNNTYQATSEESESQETSFVQEESADSLLEAIEERPDSTPTITETPDPSDVSAPLKPERQTDGSGWTDQEHSRLEKDVSPQSNIATDIISHDEFEFHQLSSAMPFENTTESDLSEQYCEEKENSDWEQQ